MPKMPKVPKERRQGNQCYQLVVLTVSSIGNETSTRSFAQGDRMRGCSSHAVSCILYSFPLAYELNNS
jgi:hypothetical protein